MRADICETESSDKVLMRILNANGLLDDEEFGSMLFESVTKRACSHSSPGGYIAAADDWRD